MWLESTSGMAWASFFLFFFSFSFKMSLLPCSAAVAGVLFDHTGIVLRAAGKCIRHEISSVLLVSDIGEKKWI